MNLIDAEKMTISAAAKAILVSRATVERMIRDGRLPSIKVGGGRRLVLKSDVEKLLRYEERIEPTK